MATDQSALAAAPLTPPSSTRAPAPRLGFVDSLRALAALYVMASHVVLTIWPKEDLHGAAIALGGAFLFGHQAVSVFIVLSGFSLTLPVARNGFRLPHGVWGFYWRRARRIAPPYYFAMGFALLLIWLVIGQPTATLWRLSLPVTSQAIVTHLLLIQDLSQSSRASINYVFWSIAMECQIYLFFPALILLWRRYHPTFAVVVVGALSVALWMTLLPTWVGALNDGGVYGFAPQFFGLFALGMFAASIYSSADVSYRRLARWYVWDGVALVAGASLVALPLSIAKAWPYQVSLVTFDLIAAVMTVGLLLAAPRAGRFNPIRAALEWRPLVWIGGFSYSLYLIHSPLIQVLWRYVLRPLGLGNTATYLLLLLVGGPLIVAAAWAFWLVCERPFLNTRPGARTDGGPRPAGAIAIVASPTPRLRRDR